MKLKMLVILMIVVLAMAVSGCAGSDEAEPKTTIETTQESAFAVGDSVAAEWSDGNLYLAEVTAVGDDGTITVTYLDDNTEGVLDDSVVFAVEEKTWEVGDRVLAVWAVARFYSGTIESMDGDDYIVAWDDDSTPSTVTTDQIIEYIAKYADDAE